MDYAIAKTQPVPDASVNGGLRLLKRRLWPSWLQSNRAIEMLLPGIPDYDVTELTKLVGFGYEPMLPVLDPRMMRLAEVGTPPKLLWISELNGRRTLKNLHTVADAIRAQEDFSKLDTQMSMLIFSAGTAPFMFFSNAGLAAAVAAGTDTVFLGVPLATDVPDFIRQREDIHFALGASLILGTRLLSEAEMRKSEWFELYLNVVPAAVGAVLSTSRVVGMVRTALIISKLEVGGLEAFKLLSPGEKAAFWRFVTEAKLLEEAG